MVNANHRFIELFEKEYQTDEMPFEDKARNILELYQEANVEQKYVMDQVFISLCGYSIHTLMIRSSDKNER